MPAFGSGGAKATPKVAFLAGGVEILGISDWLMRSHKRGYRQRTRLQTPVTRSLHLLEDAGLIENERKWAKVGARLALLRPTALGQTALTEGTVQQYLASSASN